MSNAIREGLWLLLNPLPSAINRKYQEPKTCTLQVRDLGVIILFGLHFRRGKEGDEGKWREEEYNHFELMTSPKIGGNGGEVK